MGVCRVVRAEVDVGDRAATERPTAVRRERVAWIDIYRGLAVLVMIETHVVNTFLASAIRLEPWFAVLNYVNGLVAPSFLFIAGFVQGMERGTAPEKPVNFARRARQLLLIGALGYALHFPWIELFQHRWEDAWWVGTQVDVLQCIAFSLGLLLALTWLARKLGGRRGDGVWWLGLGAFLAAAIFLAPLAQEWNGLPIPLQAWVNRSTGSWFPLFSWAGFVFFGALAGAAYGLARRTAQAPEALPAPTLNSLSFVKRSSALFLVTPIPLVLSAWAFRGATYSQASPASFFERAAWVLILAGVCEWFANRRRAPLPAFAGKNSLTLYVVHLVLISALAGGGVLTTALPLPVVLPLIAAVTAASLFITGLISRFRSRGTR
jgi:uncharacterized membrane protein